MATEAVLLIAFLCGFAVLLWRRWRRDSRGTSIALPPELRNSQLVHAESQFRSPGLVSISARVDRVYRNPAGVLVLVEMKTRRASRGQASDVIELSAQRVALTGQTGQPVAAHAYVLTQTPAGSWSGAHRVELMSPDEVMALVLRRESLLRGAEAAHRTRAAGLCRTCPFVSECRRWADNTKTTVRPPQLQGRRQAPSRHRASRWRTHIVRTPDRACHQRRG